MDAPTSFAIYSPPREGLPLILVTIKGDEITSLLPMPSNEEARRYLIKREFAARPRLNAPALEDA
jgi:hypothetical protein